MSRAERYRNFAADCVRLAQQSTNPADKALLVEMAENWIRMAKRVEARGVSGESDEEK
jgi:hypothetical protein